MHNKLKAIKPALIKAMKALTAQRVIATLDSLPIILTWLQEQALRLTSLLLLYMALGKLLQSVYAESLAYLAASVVLHFLTLWSDRLTNAPVDPGGVKKHSERSASKP
jgi:hypothetical protein